MYRHAVIILGCGVDAAGNLGRDPMASVELGLERAKQQSDSCIIMSGNVSYKATFKPSISEAQAMKEYAVGLGAAEDTIFVETESKDSLGNLYFTKQNILLPLGITDISIILGPNQSTERIDYLAKKVLGNNYNYSLIQHSEARLGEHNREQTSLKLAKRWLDPVADGDMGSIYTILRNNHPGYNSALNISSMNDLL